MKILQLTRVRLPLLLAMVVILCGGCGCPWYYAHYISYEDYEARSDLRIWDLQRAGILEMQESLGDLKVDVGLLKPMPSRTRSCFNANVWFKRDSSGINLDSLLAKTRPVGDSAVILSEDNGHLGTLSLTNKSHGNTFWSFQSDDSLCIGRRDDKLVVTYFTRLIGSSGETIESRKFEVRLHRWENRNWLGHE